ncbi:hypothetical protein [Legionella cherrii]|uniref:Uncharacterized protein n=1 Tax=Legionella cherrii TaxID=28084 RepID=A0A0W0SC47_9GAMM|nr:hypothetical protein [Legionella cherrii]KTC80946.1 hypothetical protein Lche_2966 [Legionella cherrii]VEB33989.1 Uncharacterised protein [Legionella cherrii]
MESKFAREPKSSSRESEQRDYQEPYYEEEEKELRQEPHSVYRTHTYRKRVSLGGEKGVLDLLLGNPEEKQLAINAVKEKLQQGYGFVQQTVPGFFTPFGKKKELVEQLGLSTKSEVATTVTAPITAPVVFAVVAGVAAIAAAVAALTALAKLVIAAGFGLHSLRAGKEEAIETAKDNLTTAAKAGIIAAACTVIAVAASIVTAVIAPIALLYLLTRTGATAAAEIANCAASSEESAEYRPLKM